MAVRGGHAEGRDRDPRAVVLVAALSAAVMVSGVQGIAPALPAIQAALGLSTAEVSLLTSLYLLPSIASAFPAGVLADRVGARGVFAGSLLVFGVGGGLLLAGPSFPVLLAVRAVQGAAFGVVLALSVSVIADAATTREAGATGQSRRVVAMTAGEAVLPVAGGALVALSWYAPFAIQLLALPLAVAAWVLLPRSADVRRPAERGRGGGAAQALRARGVVGVQLLGLLRFFFKFALVTYFPLLAVNERGLSTAVVGLALGASSLVGVATATLAPRLARRLSPAQLIAVDLVLAAVAFVAIAASGSPAVAIGAVLLFGLQDGVYAVAHNLLVAEAAPAGARGAYVGLTGTVRNVGKFVAPVAFGALTVVITVSQSFMVFAALGAVSAVVAGGLDRRLAAGADALPYGDVRGGGGPRHR